MKSLGAAVASAVLASIAAFHVLKRLHLDESFAAQLAAAITGAVPFMREFFESVFRTQQNSKRPAVVSVGDFGIPPQRMILYGTLLIFGAMQLASGLGGLSMALLDRAGTTSGAQRRLMFVIVAFLIQFPVIFSVGRWVGRRSASHGIAVILIISFLSRLSSMLLDLWLLTPAIKTALVPSIDFTLASVSMFVAGGTALFGLVGAVGYWRGRGERLAAYLAYLLQSVSEDTRRAIVDVAFEEARAALTRADHSSLASRWKRVTETLFMLARRPKETK
jgi:hypothetical protein